MTGVVTLGEVTPSVQLTLLSGGQDVTTSATWQSSTASVATVSVGLVRATGVGTTTVSASYKGQTVSSPVSAIEDQDCIPYDPANVSTVPALKDPTQLIITAPDPFGRAQLLSPSSDGLIDAGNLVALYRRYTQVCYVGRNNPQFMLTFFKNPSGQQTTVAPEDCVPYSAAALQVVNQGGSGWALVSGGTQLGLLVTAFDAAVASAVAAHASTECFIGRRTTRPSSSAFITEYWK